MGWHIDDELHVCLVWSGLLYLWVHNMTTAEPFSIYLSQSLEMKSASCSIELGRYRDKWWQAGCHFAHAQDGAIMFTWEDVQTILKLVVS